MTPFRELLFMFALADAHTQAISASPSPAPPIASPSATPSPFPSPAFPATPLTAHGQLLLVTSKYIVFTTGDALPLEAGTHIPASVCLGQTVRVRFDPISHRVRAVETLSGTPPTNETDAAHLPRSYVVVSAASAASNQNAKASKQSKIVSVTFIAHVPDDTPINDDVYLTTERSNFSPAELKMNRIDVRRWSVSLPLAEGATLHYQYTRGNYATVERDASGGVVTPRTIDVREGLHTDDTVARWADTS